ncbi:hypothetical protein [Gemmata sp.]|uniref:hypothetical protein n=1 Tax=Gemmata sp. TaxID=1914242 RepID=UPI003F6FA142
MIRMRLRTARVVVVLAVLFAVGCASGDGRVPVNKTTGRLEWPGHTVLGLMVVLHPTDPAAPKLPAQLTGVVQADGTFAVACYDMTDGAPAGEYVVTIREAPLPDDRPGPKLPPAKYRDAKTSPLRVTVEKKSVNELAPLTITN